MKQTFTSGFATTMRNNDMEIRRGGISSQVYCLTKTYGRLKVNGKAQIKHNMLFIASFL